MVANTVGGDPDEQSQNSFTKSWQRSHRIATIAREHCSAWYSLVPEKQKQSFIFEAPDEELVVTVPGRASPCERRLLKK